MNVFVRDGKRFVEYGEEVVCMDDDVVNETSEITNWTPPRQTAVVFANRAHRAVFNEACQYACPINGRMIFRALVTSSGPWKISQSFSANLDFVVMDGPTFGFYASSVELHVSKLKNPQLELEKTSMRQNRFPEKHLKMFSHGCELTLEETQRDFDSPCEVGWTYKDENSIRETQVVAFLIESISCERLMDAPITPMHKTALMLAASFRIAGALLLAKIRETVEDDIAEGEDFVIRHQNRKTSHKSAKDALVVENKIRKRLRENEVDGVELTTSQGKNDKRRRLLEILVRHRENEPKRSD